MRFLGNTGLMVSELWFGAMTFGGQSWWKALGEVDTPGATELVAMAIDAGINVFDTGDGYSEGNSEIILGKALGQRRNDILLSTKVFLRMRADPNSGGLSRHHIIEGCHDSLRRLGTEHIDIYHLNGFDALTPLEETMRALDDLVRQGKVRYIGCSNFTAWHLTKAMAISDARGWERFVAYQGLYTLLCREVEYEIIPACIDQGVGFLAWSPLAGGFLTGKYRPGKARPKVARRSQPPSDDGDYQDYVNEEHGFWVVDALDEIAKEHNGSVAQAALNYLLRKPGVTGVITGARTPDQLVDNLGAVEWEMTDEEVARLDEMTKLGPLFPHEHLAFMAMLR
jgi:aryl-alcohol dehydrogenase-like predicted oxidoreductase